MGSHFLLQGIFPIQELNLGLQGASWGISCGLGQKEKQALGPSAGLINVGDRILICTLLLPRRESKPFTLVSPALAPALCPRTEPLQRPRGKIGGQALASFCLPVRLHGEVPGARALLVHSWGLSGFCQGLGASYSCKSLPPWGPAPNTHTPLACHALSAAEDKVRSYSYFQDI